MANITTPHHKGTKRLFDNQILESLTRTHILFPLSIYTMISAVCVYIGIANFGLTVLNIVALFIAGFMSFTLIEYIMHRFVFHMKPDTPKKEKISYTIHGVHHDYPKDKDRLAMPIPLSILLSAVFYFLFDFIMGDYALGFLPGFLMGYTAYLGVHYSVHAFRPPNNFLKILWVHHGIHHYKDPEHAFGVSSPFWDLIFGSMPKK
ncbi:MAG TPA: sterol desaturase family protein [Cyclobacteriaceae bacterium]